MSALLLGGAGVPVAPAIPAAALVVMGLLAFTAFLIATGMGKLYAETIGHMIRWIAKNIDVDLHIPHFGGHPFHSVSHGLYRLDKHIANGFAAAALKAEAGAAWCFTTAGNIIEWTARETADLAHDILGALQHTTISTIPAAIRHAQAATLEVLRGIDHNIGRLEAQVEAQLKRLLHGIDRLGHRLETKIAAAVLGAIALARRLEKRVRGLDKRLSRVESKWRIAAFTALVSIALTRMGLRWLRCPSLLRMGRRIGCNGFAFAESLMALTFVPLALQDACKLMRQFERLAVAIQPALVEFVLGVEGWICGGPQSLPSGIQAGDLKRVAKLPSGL